jgi:malate synthase
MGGMAAYIPVKDNPKANETALAKVRADKEREVLNGHDGTWVAHPGLVGIAKNIFDKYMPEPNQIYNKMEDIRISSEDLLELPIGTITIEGLKTNINVAVRYLEAWLRGNGCVPLYNLMEDAATAEISRTQIWQWLHNSEGILEDGTVITYNLFNSLLQEEIEKIKSLVGKEKFYKGAYGLAVEILNQLATEKDFTEFLTLNAYEYI